MVEIKQKLGRGDMTSANLALTAVGNGVGVLIRPSLTAPTDTLRSARCVSAWTLAAMCCPEKFQESYILIPKLILKRS